VSIPVTNTSVNPARSTGTTLVAGGAYVIELWLFWAAPIIGAIIAGLLARRIYEREALIQTMLWRKAGSLSAILQAGRLRPPGFTVDR
jgi:aquaporin Z